jgi:7,8-dihydropterin-6-yl-methyl-4-(beta-D-ribofuranosyl)aminobenzene 5'-phosphate synthase
LAKFFKENTNGTVYLRRSVKGDQVGVVPSHPVKFIGLDKKLLDEHANRIVYVADNLEVSPGFHLVTDIPDVYGKPSGDQRLKIRQNGKLMPDTFEHELVTVVEMDDALVVLTGCAHNGVLNMIEAVHRALPNKPIQAVIGGFHLGHEAEEKVIEIGEALLSLGIPEIYTGHCTGDKAVDLLAEVLGERLHRLYTGLMMEI